MLSPIHYMCVYTSIYIYKIAHYSISINGSTPFSFTTHIRFVHGTVAQFLCTWRFFHRQNKSRAYEYVLFMYTYCYNMFFRLGWIVRDSRAIFLLNMIIRAYYILLQTIDKVQEQLGRVWNIDGKSSKMFSSCVSSQSAHNAPRVYHNVTSVLQR